jgi:hypothetical protein
VIVTIFEAALFTQVGNPTRWYPMSVLLGLVFWIMFAYEQRLYRVRFSDSAGPAGAALLDVLERDHRRNLVALVPVMLVTWGAFAAGVHLRRDLFVDRGWHVALGCVQAAGMLGYLAYVWRFYAKVSGLIVAARAEWHASE